MKENAYPVTLLQHGTGEAVGTGSNIAGWATDEALIHNSYLQEILRQGSGLQIIIVRLANASKETHRSRPSELKLQHAKHEAFGLQNLIDGVTSIHHVDDLVYGRTIDLFVLGSNEYSGGANQLELAQRDNLAGQEAVDVVDTEE